MHAFQVRGLAPHDVPLARSLAREEGLQALYLANQLEEEERTGACAGRLYGVFSRDGLVQVAFFGERGQMAATAGPAGACSALSDLAFSREYGWRMFIGPRELAASIVARVRGRARLQLDRPQLFFAVVDPERISPETTSGAPEVRKAAAADVERLCDASLELNREDLGIQPGSIDRRSMRRHLRGRIDEDRTWVIGPPGEFSCKLDLGSVGPAGVMIEGVYTFPHHRRRGLARRLVATVARRFLPRYPAVCLHLGGQNLAARHAYEAAGMYQVAELRLLLVTPAPE